MLGNADAVADAWFLKRMPDADGSNDYYMWQVANGIRVILTRTAAIRRHRPAL